MDEHFGISERNSSVAAEIRGGLTAFLVMASIMVTNASIFERLGTASYSAVYFATGISAAIFTLVMGLAANLPVAVASYSGVTGFLVYSVCITNGLTYANAMLIVLLEGVVFTLLTATGLRKRIFAMAPECVRLVVPVAVGLYLMYIGLQNSGIIMMSESTASSMSSFNVLSEINGWTWLMPKLTAVFTLLVITVLAAKQVKGALIWGLVSGTAVYYLLGITVPGVFSSLNINAGPAELVSEWLDISFLKVFTEGFDFTYFSEAGSGTNLVFVIISSVIAVFTMDFIASFGVLCGVNGYATVNGDIADNYNDSDNDNDNDYSDGHDFKRNVHIEKGMLVTGIGILFSSMLGASPVTPVPQSAAGAADGGRTGLSSVFTAVLLFIAAFFSPLSTLIPGAVAGAVVAFAGLMLTASLFKALIDALLDKTDRIDKTADIGSGASFSDINGISDLRYTEFVIPAVTTLAMVPLSCSVSAGIFAGIASYILTMLFTGNSDRLRASMWIIASLYIFTLLFTN